jgi:hypothetical protein
VPILRSLFAACLFTQLGIAVPAQTPIIIGESVQLESKTLGELRSLLVSKPASYDKGDDRYPVLYVLDGQTHFSYVSAMVGFWPPPSAFRRWL